MLLRNQGSRRLVAGLLAFAAASAPVIVHASTPLEVLIEALVSGSAAGTVTGKAATQWSETTKSAEPIAMTAKLIKRYAQAGCGRLQVTMRQHGVPTKGGGKVPFITQWEVNLCTDGSAPREGVDLSGISAEQNMGGRP